MKKTSFYFMIVLIWICGKIIFKNQFYNFHIIIQLSKYKKLTGWLCNYSGWHGLITTGFPEWLRLKLRQKQKDSESLSRKFCCYKEWPWLIHLVDSFFFWRSTTNNFSTSSLLMFITASEDNISIEILVCVHLRSLLIIGKLSKSSHSAEIISKVHPFFYRLNR